MVDDAQECTTVCNYRTDIYI